MFGEGHAVDYHHGSDGHNWPVVKSTVEACVHGHSAYRSDPCRQCTIPATLSPYWTRSSIVAWLTLRGETGIAEWIKRNLPEQS